MICRGRDGRPSGDCFVKFRETEDFEKALKRDRAQMQRRYVEVFASTNIDMASGKRSGEFSLQRQHNEDPHYQGVVRMRGLPFSANPSDIQAFFRDLEIREGGVHVCEGRDGRPNGEVSFARLLQGRFCLPAPACDCGFGSCARYRATQDLWWMQHQHSQFSNISNAYAAGFCRIRQGGIRE